jgi:hypothetical protein
MSLDEAVQSLLAQISVADRAELDDLKYRAFGLAAQLPPHECEEANFVLQDAIIERRQELDEGDDA